MDYVDSPSPYNRAQAQYEKALGEAKASDQDRRKSHRQEIEDSLVEGGMEAIDEYKRNLDEKWKAAICLAEFDGLSMGYRIVQRA